MDKGKKDQKPVDEWTGYSAKFSIEEAFKNAIAEAPTDIPTDYFKYLITEIGYEEGGILQVHNVFVKIKRVGNTM